MHVKATHLSKRYGRNLVVDDVGFALREGQITGFLGPNGAGKSTTMRMLVGLHRPDRGSVTYDGKSLGSYAAPLRVVGSVLDADAFDPRNTPLQHLKAHAATHSISRRRVDEMISLTGLASVADKRTRVFSLGMKQRLGIATALLGDPEILVLDEPINGLDAEGVRWVRNTLRSLADEGRTILISSHLMGEMADTADHLIVIGKGQVLTDAPLAEVITGTTSGAAVRVRTSQLSRLIDVLPSSRASVDHLDDSTVNIRGLDIEEVGRLAAEHAIVLFELSAQEASLEEAYLDLTLDAVEYRSGAAS